MSTVLASSHNLTHFALEGTNPTGLQGKNPKPGSVTDTRGLTNPLKAKSIGQLFADIIQVIIIFATPIIVLFIMYAGFLYVTARGNADQIKKAHSALLWAIIGGVILLGAELIIRVIEGTVQGLK